MSDKIINRESALREVFQDSELFLYEVSVAIYDHEEDPTTPLDVFLVFVADAGSDDIIKEVAEDILDEQVGKKSDSAVMITAGECRCVPESEYIEDIVSIIPPSVLDRVEKLRKKAKENERRESLETGEEMTKQPESQVRQESAESWIDMEGTEKSRTYHYPPMRLMGSSDDVLIEAHKVTIEKPAKMMVKKSGSIHIVDEAGIHHYIKPGWTRLTWDGVYDFDVATKERDAS